MALLVAAAGACRSEPADPADEVAAAAEPAPGRDPVASEAPPAAAAAAAAPSGDDAAQKPPEPAITAADILSGPEAEAVIAAQKSPPTDAGLDPEERFAISPLGVGSFRLGMTRTDVLLQLVPSALRRVRAASAAEPSIEWGTVSVDGSPMMLVKLFAARVTEIQVIWRDHRAATDGEVMVGSTFQEVADAHGEPRRVRDGSGVRGWAYSALPGVVFAPADPTLLTGELPRPEGRVGRIVVVGPENLSPAD